MKTPMQVAEECVQKTNDWGKDPKLCIFLGPPTPACAAYLVSSASKSELVRIIADIIDYDRRECRKEHHKP